MTEQLRVFVYGTLKPGEANYHYCEGHVEFEMAIAPGVLYDLPMGYPAITAGEGWVKGYLFTFCDSALLQALDELEDYDPHRPPEQNEYLREWIAVYHPDEAPMGYAWCYRMTEAQARAFGGIRVPGGWWTGGNQ